MVETRGSTTLYLLFRPPRFSIYELLIIHFSGILFRSSVSSSNRWLSPFTPHFIPQIQPPLLSSPSHFESKIFTHVSLPQWRKENKKEARRERERGFFLN